MIKVQDWVASIPDEDKHIAYVGEDKSETRQFLLSGEGWRNYEYWQFHLDMAFDPESITTRDSRQVVQTTHNRTENTEEKSKSVDEVTTKETYTVHDEERANYSLTDIASLAKEVREDGILLTWTVLRQHTLLPGKLWATLRALGDGGERIKKSAIMVFEVDAAINAVPAARPARSEFEEMEARISAMCQDAAWSSGNANHFAIEAEQFANQAAESATQLAEDIREVEGLLTQTQEHCDAAHRTVDAAEAARADAQTAANTAATYAAQTTADAQACADAQTLVAKAVERCSRYTVECDSAVQRVEKSVQTLENLTYHRVNVRDCGAVGDGVTDDRAAIVAAFEQAKQMLPCEVYFPAGEYGISNGITVEMAYGTGSLLVRGAGRDVTTIKYLESYDPDQKGNMWYAIRIWPVGMPETKPTNEDDHLHDISITGLTVFDTDPIAHAWHPDKGDPDKEETHGFDIQFCKRVSVTDCNIFDVGDEGIDICGCHDVIVTNNHLVGSPAAGASGGAISIGDGCKGVVVSGNTVNGVAIDGTVNTKGNFGIAVESLTVPVRDVVIANNVVSNICGNGVNLGAANAGSGLYNISVTDNLIQNCNNGIADVGTHPRDGVKICDNTFIDCVVNEADGASKSGFAIYFGYPHTALLVSGNTIRNTHGNYAVRLACGENLVLFSNNVLENIGNAAIGTGGNVVVRDCIITNTGVEDATATAAITPLATTSKLCVYGCKMTGVRQSKAIHNATEVESTLIDMVDADGNRYTNANTLGGNLLERVVNCRFDGYVIISKDNAIVQSNTITNGDGWANTVAINANGVIVSGNNITQADKSKNKKAIAEGVGKNHNLIIGNICNTSITTAGAQSVAANNIDTSATA